MSERELSNLVKAEVEKSSVRIAIFVELIFDSGTVRAWSGYGDYTLNGNIFNGVGHLGAISPIEETIGDVRASGISISLSGIPSEMIAQCFENCQSRPATIWIAFFDEKWVLIPENIVVCRGRMDYHVIEESGDTAKVTLFIESRLIDLERPRIRRYTDEDQRNLYEGDTGLRFISAIQNKNVTWAA